MKQFPIAFCLLAATGYLTGGVHAQDTTTALTRDTRQTNLLQNGNFETSNDSPQNWAFVSANPEIFTTKIEPLDGNGKVLHLESTDAKMSGYWAQTATVKPHTNYVLQARARLDRGKILIWVINAKGEKKLDNRAYVETLNNHPLVPLFWKPEWVMGNTNSPSNGVGPSRTLTTLAGEWKQVTLPFNSAEFDSVRVNFGAYFEAGNYWFDDLVLREASGADTQVQTAQTQTKTEEKTAE